jgi:adenylate cyclase
MLRFRVRNERQSQDIDHLSGPFEFGRGGPQNGVPRFVIQDLYVSANHVGLLELPDGRVRITNLSLRNNIRLTEGVIAVGGVREVVLPTRLTVGETTVDIEPAQPVLEPEPEVETADFEGPLQTIASPLKPGGASANVPPSLAELGQTPTAERLAGWFESIIAVQRAAAGSAEFFRQTASTIVSQVGLDRGLVILRRNNRWMVQARYPDDDGSGSRGREFSTTILARVEQERRTFYQSEASASGSGSESLQGVEAVVASPIFGANDQHVVGIVYGCRNKYSRHRGGVGIGPLEAQVMQLLAAAVGAGLARQEQEAEASRLRVQFDQFFPPELARELERNPRLLEGQEREVTVMFGDIRGFSRISERLGPRDTCKLAASVMDRLTARILEYEGVVVDYAGDGIMAMWNAPTAVPDHAIKACRAGLAMLGDLPGLDAEWRGRLDAPLKIGIGLNTGLAMCGNTGARQRFKYGPLGHTVNLASRVEGATKSLGVPLLITGSTRTQIDDTFATRRLCKVRVVGIVGAVDLYEVHSADGVVAEWIKARDAYEAALRCYEAGDFANACRSLYALFEPRDEHHDLPSLNLSARAIDALRSRPENFDGILELVQK